MQNDYSMNPLAMLQAFRRGAPLVNPSYQRPAQFLPQQLAPWTPPPAAAPVDPIQQRFAAAASDMQPWRPGQPFNIGDMSSVGPGAGAGDGGGAGGGGGGGK